MTNIPTTPELTEPMKLVKVATSPQERPTDKLKNDLVDCRELVGDHATLRETGRDSMYRHLVKETTATTQSDRDETMVVHVDPITDPKWDTLVADVVDKEKAPGVVIFHPHKLPSFHLSSFAMKTGYTYSMGGAYPDGNLMRIVGHKGQSARELTNAVIKAGFVPFDQLPNVMYRFKSPTFEQLFNLKMIAHMLKADVVSEHVNDVGIYTVTFTTDYQLKGFLSFIEEAELLELAVALSRWDK